MNTRLLIGIALMVVGLFWSEIKNSIPDFPDNKPTILIEKPEASLIEVWSDTANSITDPKDRLYLCMFNKVFAERVLRYDTDSQQINDVYVLAAKELFGSSIKGKYDKLAPSTKRSMTGVLGEENHSVVESEKQKLNKVFLAFAWCLSRKDYGYSK